MYVGRVALALAPLALARYPSTLGPSRGSVVLAILAVTLGFTALSFWSTHLRGRRPGETFLYGQLIFDVLLLTGVVQLTGGEESLFAPLYILLICTAALLLSTLGGILTGLLGIVLYLGSALWSSGGELQGAVLLQIALFAIVALVTGYLGERLRAAGTELGEVRTELAQLRLDTADILSTMSTGVLTVDGEGRLAYLNPAAEDILALPWEQWVGQPVIERLDRIAPGLGEVIARSARDRVAIRRFETEPVAEEAFVLGVSTTLVERIAGERPAITAIFQDITEKVRVEGLRRRAERLEAVAELSASLAHEIKNPLASIRSAVEQIAEGSLDEEDVQVLKGLTTRESDRLSRLLAEFIDFARVQVDAPQPVDFPALVTQVVQLVRAHPDAAGRTVELAVEGSPAQVWVRGSEDLLHRAVFNLALNALQWAGEGGRVQLTLDAVRSDLLSPALGALNLVRLTVTDTGPGVAEEIEEQIFDPFFTRRSGGTGLGLALVQRAMEAHGGAIFVDNAPAGSGLGASFTVYLPVLPPELAAAVGVTENEQPSLT
jgi:two-component system sensor histidine kinase PilS (NtrC family)